MLLAINIISDVIKLPIIHRLLSSISTYGILVLVIIFQPELRKMLEQIATSKIIKYFKFLANGKVYKNQGAYYTK